MILAFFIGTKFPRQTEHRTQPTAVAEPTQVPPIEPEPAPTSEFHIKTEWKDDGAFSLWIQSDNGLQLTRYDFDPNKELLWKSVWSTNERGDPKNCKIYDHQMSQLFRITYGYLVSDGRLAEERVFDSQQKRFNEKGTETPIRRILHPPHEDNSNPIIFDSLAHDYPSGLEMVFRNPFE